MKSRLILSPFERGCKARQLSSGKMSPKDRRWHASFPRKADHLLYEILSYTLDAHFKYNFMEEVKIWKMLVPEKDEFAGVDESLKTYVKTLGSFWKFKVVYESLTYVTFFACHSKMTHSSAIWRALQGDVVHFSWLAQSFPHIAINFIQSGSPLMGVCLFMSLYSAVASSESKFAEVHDHLRDRTIELREQQEEGKKKRVPVKVAERETVIQVKTPEQESQQMNVHFVSEISGGQEALRRDPDDECMDVKCEYYHS